MVHRRRRWQMPSTKRDRRRPIERAEKGKCQHCYSIEIMRILAIETSCDETAAAVVENGWKVLSNMISSSLKLHQETGGIVPEVAARAQVEAIIPVIHQALEQAFPKKTRVSQIKAIDAIAVTSEPGLVTSLLVGTQTASILSFLWNKPLIPVHHVHGHVYANWLDRDPRKDPICYPVVSLSVSGGHNELMLITEKKLRVIGETHDDSAGEVFDKIARVLGLGYPGGPEIERLSKNFESMNFPHFPRAWLGNSFDFSFSGLKSEVIREIQRKQYDSKAIAYGFQEAVFDVLVTKLLGAAKKYKAKEIHIAGGVSANKRFRNMIEERLLKEPRDIRFRTPEKMIYCTDNAAMIGAAAYIQTARSKRSTLP